MNRFSLVLISLLFGVSAHADQATNAALLKTLTQFRETAVKANTDLQNEIRAFQAGGVKYVAMNDARGAAKKVHQELIQLRKGLEKYFAETSSYDYKGLEGALALTLDLYKFRKTLYVVSEILPFAYSASSLKELDVNFNKAACMNFSVAQSSTIAANKLDLLEMTLLAKKKKDGSCSIEISPTEHGNFDNASFAAFPIETRAYDRLRDEGLRLAFLQHGAISARLYADERKKLSLNPADASPWHYDTLTNAELLNQEDLFRKRMSALWLKPASDHFKKQINPHLQAELPSLVQRLIFSFRHRLSPEVIGNLHKGLTEGKLVADKSGADMLERYKKSGLSVDEALALSASFAGYIDSIISNGSWVKVRSYNGFFTSMSFDAFSDYLFESYTSIVREQLEVVFGQFFFNLGQCDGKPECFTTEERVAFSAAIDAIVRDAHNRLLTNENQRNQWDAKAMVFYRHVNELDAITSYHRYMLADRAIRMVLETEFLKKLLNEAEKTPGNQIAATTFVDYQPDPVKVLLAIDYGKGIPAWLGALIKFRVKSLQEVDTALERSYAKSDAKEPLKADQEALKTVLTLRNSLLKTPAAMAKLADYALSVAQSHSAAQTLPAAHKKLLNGYVPFEWHTVRLQMQKVIESSGADQGLISTLTVLSSMIDMARERDATGLVDDVSEAYKSLIKGSYSGMESLVKKTRAAANWMADSRHTMIINGTFQLAKARNQYLNSLLVDKTTFKAYVSFKLNEIRSYFPGLFLSVSVPRDIAEATGFKKQGVMLYDLILWLIGDPACEGTSTGNGISGRCNLGGIASTVDNSYEWFERAEKSLRAGDADSTVRALRKRFNQKIEIGANLRTIITSAINGHLKSRPMEQSTIGVFVKKHLDSRYGPNYASAKEEYWPQSLKVRDIYPALFDTDLSKSKDAGVRVANARAKFQRVLVSALLAPYMRTGLDSAENAVESLFGAKYAKCKNVSKASDPHQLDSDDSKCYNANQLVKIAALDSVASKLGDESSELLFSLREDHSSTEKFLTKWKEFLAPIRESSHYAFFGMVILGDKLGTVANLGLMTSLALSGLADLVPDVGLTMIYANDYRDLRPFGNTGVTGDGLYKQEDFETLRQKYYMHMEMIVSRLPMDLMFTRDAKNGWMHLLRGKRMALRHQAGGDFYTRYFNQEAAWQRVQRVRREHENALVVFDSAADALSKDPNGLFGKMVKSVLLEPLDVNGLNELAQRLGMSGLKKDLNVEELRAAVMKEPRVVLEVLKQLKQRLSMDALQKDPKAVQDLLKKLSRIIPQAFHQDKWGNADAVKSGLKNSYDDARKNGLPELQDFASSLEKVEMQVKVWLGIEGKVSPRIKALPAAGQTSKGN